MSLAPFEPPVKRRSTALVRNISIACAVAAAVWWAAERSAAPAQPADIADQAQQADFADQAPQADIANGDVEPPTDAEIAALRDSALAGYADAQARLGRAYRIAEGVPVDYAEAIKWTRLAAAQDHPGALTDLGDAYSRGLGVAMDTVRAAELYQRSQAMMWRTDVSSAPVSTYAESAALRDKAITGDAAARNRLGIAYAKGEGVKTDPVEAEKWFRLAAAQGDPAAQTNLGILYRKEERLPDDSVQAAEWLRRMDVTAQSEKNEDQLGIELAYDLVDRASKDDTEANKWFVLAAAQAYAPAQFFLGWDSVDWNYYSNYSVAQKWLRLAAAQGYAPAQFLLGSIYGRAGIAENQQEAVKWYNAAAAQGHPRALEELESRGELRRSRLNEALSRDYAAAEARRSGKDNSAARTAGKGPVPTYWKVRCASESDDNYMGFAAVGGNEAEHEQALARWKQGGVSQRIMMAYTRCLNVNWNFK